MTSETTEISADNLDAGIDALSRASKAFQLSRFDTFAYRFLMVLANIFIINFSTFLVFLLAGYLINDTKIDDGVRTFLLLAILTLIAALLVVLFLGLCALILIAPLTWRMFWQARKLNSLGVTNLSGSFWIESQRGRLVAKIRPIALITISGITLLIAVLFTFFFAESNSKRLDDTIIFASIVFVFLFVALFMFTARYTRYQRERIELASSAAILKNSLEKLRESTGQQDTVTVQVQVLNQAARIESATIAQERSEAVLQSAASRHSGYTIRFGPAASSQRLLLEAEDRVELEDIVADLSSEGPQGEPTRQHGRSEIVGQRLKIDYELDESARAILIAGLRRIHAAPGDDHA
jgi:hypothetical protein